MGGEIKVRRAGLVSFGVKIGSTLTGLIFVVVVTRNLSILEFGLWQLISRTVAYSVFAANILYFWTLRYRARGVTLGKTVLVGSFIFAAVLTLVYLITSLLVANSVGQASPSTTNLYFFLVSTPAVPLYIIVGTLEYILWGFRPEVASYGFGIFEIAKVIIGGVLVAVFRLSLTGAILGVIGAQVVQLVVTVVLTRREYFDKVSFVMLGTMLKTGWLALLNSLYPLVMNFDFLVVGLLTGSANPLAIYGAAVTIATVLTYSSVIASGLYASILGGKDPRQSTNQVLELQYLFTLPMLAGVIILSHDLLSLLKPVYTQAVPILIVLAFGAALFSFSLSFDTIVTGTDTTDASREADFALYSKSKMFLISKINIVLAAGYLAVVTITASIFKNGSGSFLGIQGYGFLFLGWSIAYFSMGLLAVVFKLNYVRKITTLLIPMRTASALSVGTVAFTVVLYLLSIIIHPSGGVLLQAGRILLIGAISLSVYAAIVLVVSSQMRALAKSAIHSILRVS